jgi:glutamyl-tRNA synthetase
MTIRTRFAPSPTGVLHTGSARTALFNYLFSKHNKGEFLLRIEDTDKERSKPEHTEAILNDLKWLGLEHDGEIIYQSQRSERHVEVAKELLKNGMAYKCYTSAEDVELFRSENPHAKFRSSWRDKTPNEAPDGVSPAIRLRAPLDGETLINDLIQGEITVNNSEMDDMVLLRSDGTPTYMLAVVVDDFDMGITHVIRGDDHLTNSFRQKQLYNAMKWEVPNFAHIPLILDSEGKKLSKRKGALGIEEYKNLGYLPDAVLNHLLRLGWGHGDDEIISREEAIEWFTLAGVGKAGARFDIAKLNHINAHYMRQIDNDKLIDMIKAKYSGHSEVVYGRIFKGLEGLKNRAHTVDELIEGAGIYVAKKDQLDEKSIKVLSEGGKEILAGLKPILEGLDSWTEETIKLACNEYVVGLGKKPPASMMALRAGVIGTFAAPGIFEVMDILGKSEVMERLAEF